jgi:soluble lytic murein transglycosylase
MSTSQQDITTLTRVVELVEASKQTEATQAAAALADPVARKLAEWLVLRSSDNGASSERYRAFINASPDWPGLSMFRRRGEAALWDDNRDDATVLAFFGNDAPLSAKGRFMLARALLTRGDRAGAERLVKAAWRGDAFSGDTESAALERFGALLTAGDHKARMDYLLFQEESTAALRSAQRLGGNALAIAKARAAVFNEGGNAGKMLDAVPADARNDPGYIFSRAQWLRRTDKIAEAAKMLLMAPRETSRAVNGDEWWQERRLVARKLLDMGDPRTAYLIARDGPRPDKQIYQADQEFTAGWIALRFLNDPTTALSHFGRIAPGASNNPAALSRGGYWYGRAAEALGRSAEARTAYEHAAEHSTSYYGQLARAKLGLPQLALHGQPRSRGGERLEVVRAVELLYALEEKDLAISMLHGLVDQTDNLDALVALAELTVRYKDPRGTLIIGKGALNRGLPFDVFAFPLSGVPQFKQVGNEVEDSLVYSIARQESAFNPKVVSPAKAMGLLQVLPATARHYARKYGVSYEPNRLLSDPAYNASLGAAMLGDLVSNYRGSYILTAVGYNAGPGRVRDWVQKYGDPRDPKVDAIDWVERIPFSETRNYVQRIVENMQVYRARFGGDHRLMIEADLRRGAAVQE